MPLLRRLLHTFPGLLPLDGDDPRGRHGGALARRPRRSGRTHRAPWAPSSSHARHHLRARTLRRLERRGRPGCLLLDPSGSPFSVPRVPAFVGVRRAPRPLRRLPGGLRATAPPTTRPVRRDSRGRIGFLRSGVVQPPRRGRLPMTPWARSWARMKWIRRLFRRPGQAGTQRFPLTSARSIGLVETPGAANPGSFWLPGSSFRLGGRAPRITRGNALEA